MKNLTKLLAGILTVTMASNLALAQSSVEDKAALAQAKKLESQTLAAIVAANVATQELTYTLKGERVVPGFIPFTPLSAGVAMAGSISITGAVGAGLGGGSESGPAVSMTGIVLEMGFGFMTMGAQEWNKKVLAGSGPEKVAQKIRDDYEVDKLLDEALAPWSEILALEGAQKARLKTAVKNDLVRRVAIEKEIFAGEKDMCGYKECNLNGEMKMKIDVAQAAFKAGLISEKTLNSVHEIFANFVKVADPSAAKHDLKEIMALDIETAETVIAQLEKVAASDKLAPEERKKLEISIAKLRYQLDAARDFQAVAL